MGTRTLSSGSASFAISTLTVGNHPIVAYLRGLDELRWQQLGRHDAAHPDRIAGQYPDDTAYADKHQLRLRQGGHLHGGRQRADAGGRFHCRRLGQLLRWARTCSAPPLIKANGQATITTDRDGALGGVLTTSPPRLSTTTNFATSTSAPLVQNVSAAGTTITLKSSAPGNVNVAQAITYTATVVPASGGVATGSVVFDIDSGAQTFTVALSGGKATLPFAGFLSVGSHTVTATYQPTANFAAGPGASINQIARVSATMSVGVTPNPVIVGNPVVLNATVVGSAGTPTGTVTIYDGTLILGTVHPRR